MADDIMQALCPIAADELFAVRICEYVSGNSSVPWSVPVGETLGYLRYDAAAFVATIVDDDGCEVARIERVYDTTDERADWPLGAVHIEGWLRTGERFTWGKLLLR